MKNDTIKSVYAVGDTVKVTDQDSPYYDKIGTVDRLGLANPVTLVHVRLNGVLTVITFNEAQLEKTSEAIVSPDIAEEPVRVNEGMDEPTIVETPINEEMDIASKVEAPVKRGRGRPKGSKNKPK